MEHVQTLSKLEALSVKDATFSRARLAAGQQPKLVQTTPNKWMEILRSIDGGTFVQCQAHAVRARPAKFLSSVVGLPCSGRPLGRLLRACNGGIKLPMS